MRRIRLVIAAVVAVATVSLGAVACTPADQLKAETAIQTLVNFIPAIIAWNILDAACHLTGPPCADG